MQDESIFKISIVTTIIGIIAIIILTGYVNPQELTIAQIDQSKIDNQVQIEATINSITTTKTNTTIMELSDNTGHINLVIFPSTYFKNTFSNGNKVQVESRVTQYNGQTELILEDASKIKLIT